MAAESHALLGASSAKRWLECTPSARASERFEDRPSAYADEGTRAHLLCEHKVRKALNLNPEPLPEGVEFDGEMEECSEQYLSFVLELVSKAREPIPAVEARVDFSDVVPEGFGTADFILISGDAIHIVDYKHGKGVEVSAVENPQMMLYAIGALNAYGAIYDLERVSMTIFQPRLGNVSTYETTREELEKWAKDYVKPRAELAWKGEGILNDGPWCRFCKCKATCRKRAETAMELAKHEFKDPALLSDDEIAGILGKAEEVASWAADVKDYALGEAIKGKRFPGWKVVEGRSIRKLSDEAKAAEAVLAIGKDPYEKKLLSITELTKLLGKKRFDELLGALVYKPPGKPTLAPESDKRPEFAVDSARNDFNDNKED